MSTEKNDFTSPVSQAWFTTKEDKDTLANKGTRTFTHTHTHTRADVSQAASCEPRCHDVIGRFTGHKWKQGMWSKEEIDLLMSNIERYLKVLLKY